MSKKRKISPPRSNKNKKRKLEQEAVKFGDSTDSDAYDSEKENNDNKNVKKPKSGALLWGELIDALTAKYKDVLHQKGIVKFAQLLYEAKDNDEYSVHVVPVDIMREYGIKQKSAYSTTTTHEQLPALQQLSAAQQLSVSHPLFALRPQPMNPNINMQLLQAQAQIMAQAQLLAQGQIQPQSQSITPNAAASYQQFYPGFANLLTPFTTPRSAIAKVKDKGNEKDDKKDEKEEIAEKEEGKAKSPTYEELLNDMNKLDDPDTFAPLPINTEASKENAGALEILED